LRDSKGILLRTGLEKENGIKISRKKGERTRAGIVKRAWMQ